MRWRIDHVFFWLTYAWTYSVLFPLGEGRVQSFVIANGLLLFHALVAYFNNDYLIPRLLLARNYLLYILSLGLAIVSVCFPLSIVVHIIVVKIGY
ncbi:MAG: hypothetical protein P8I77_04945, partial [Bacteroidia bacterium]|nr:hypothetical protein [Bacteroidia bacterium]